MPALVRRLRTVLITLTAAVLAGGLLAPAAAAAPVPPGIDPFMRAMGQVESSSRYTALNPVSGAYGKYQIMPFNWPGWAKAFLGDAQAPQTPHNQETVARGQMIKLYRWLGSWPRVAHWWLTGSSNPVEQWTTTARRYVDKVMALAGGLGPTMASAAPGPARTTKSTSKAASGATAPGAAPAPPPAPVHVGERDPAIVYSGSWGSAGHAGYAGGLVAWASGRGASATVTFTGRSVTWIGPAGPTRGAAKVYIDGVLVGTVTQFAGSFSPQRATYTGDFGAGGRHTLRIVVVGTAGHPMVAIDELVVGF